MAKARSQKKGNRKPRLSSLLEHKLAEYFKQEMELPGLVSISFVDVAPNMQSATIWLSIYGTDENEILKSLKRESRQLRHYLTTTLSTKYIPQLQFKIDTSQEHAQKISEALRTLDSDND